MKSYVKRAAVILGTAGLIIAVGGAAAVATSTRHTMTRFHMVRSTASENAQCLKGAKIDVTIQSKGQVEVMRIKASGLPKNTDFDLFVIQVPNAPFGMSWYQGDLDSNAWGWADGTFVGRFSVETFSVAPGSAPAPVVHTAEPTVRPTGDASTNPKTDPIHQYHLGLWFNSEKEAQAAGCAAGVTPFNGDHTAGVQAFSTKNFPNDQGPLRVIQP